MKQKILTLVVMLLMSALTVQAQSVYFKCNVNTINKRLGQISDPDCTLDKQGGFVYIPKSMYGSPKGSNGIMIIHCNHNDTYYAFDRLCRECKKNGRGTYAVYMVTNVNCICPHCESAFQNVLLGMAQQTNHSGAPEYWLKTYNVYDRGNGNLVITDKFIPEFLGI